jgi:uncharacterized membrane protein
LIEALEWHVKSHPDRFGPGGVNTVRSPTGHFCIPTSCAGFQPGAWRFVNAEAKDLLAPFGITIRTTIASG